MYRIHKYLFFSIRKFTISFSPNSLHTLCAVWSKPTIPISRWCRVWKAMSSTWIFLMLIPYPEEVDPAPAPGCVQWMGPQQPNLRDSNWDEGLYHSHIHSLLWGWSINLHRSHFPALTLLTRILHSLWPGFPEQENPGVLHTFLYHFIFPILKYRRAAESRKK